jgi:chromosome segregation protein
MKIKRLEIMGFKSFMSKTVINFDSGLVGIVGPNGCGKSNILEALVWVMGEQSSKKLRGKNMEDVIFHGSNTKKAASVAQVSVVLENDGVFPANYLNFTEIKVTRRLYRSGESEYLINKVPVRLKDVKEIFMDSGARTYAVVEQGEVDRLIFAKPEERRVFIEEAAGVTKYKTRKEESKRKLDTTEQNLLRLNDIISELSKQLSLLEKQAKKAKKYKEVKEELKNTDIKIGIFDYLNLDSELNELREKLKTLEAKKEELENILSTKELDLETNKAKKIDIEEKLNELQEKTISLNTEIHRASAKLDVNKEEYKNIEKNKELRSYELESLKVRIENTEKELETVEDDFSSNEDVINDAKTVWEEKKTKLEAKLKELEELKNRQEEEKNKLLELVQNELNAGNNITNNSERIESNLTKLDKYNADKEKNGKEIESTKADLEKIEHQLKSYNKVKEELLNKNIEVDHKRAEIKKMLEEKSEEIEENKNRLSNVNSRIDVLTELSKKHDGISMGAKNIINSAKWQDNVKGLVAEFIDTDKEYERAVGAALGETLEGVIVDSGNSIISIVESLKNESKGVACFIPYNLKRTKNNELDGVFSKKSFVNHVFSSSQNTPKLLSSFVRVKGNNKELIENLLSNVYVVENLNQAIECWYKASNYTNFMIVTKEGDVLKGNGVVKGGSKQSLATNILERKREIASLKQEQEKLLVFLDVLKEDVSVFKEESEKLELEMQASKEEVSNINVKIASFTKETDLVKEDLNRKEKRLEELNFEIDQLRFENSHLEKSAEEAKTVLKESGENKSWHEAKIQELDKKIKEFELALDGTRREVTDANIHYSTLTEKFRGVEERKAFLEEALKADKNRINNLTEENSRNINRKEELEKENLNFEEKNKENIELLDSVNRKILEIKDEHSSFLTTLETLEKEIKETRTELNDLTKNISEINVTLAESSVNTGVLKQRFFDKYEVDISDMIETYKIEDVEIEKEKETLQELNQKIADMGEVNVLAIEEFKNIEERHEFLSKQRDDLIKSISDLNTAIKKIDDTSKSRFKETFNLVNEKFQKFFPILFGGGNAKLVMTNPNDLLLTGIDIEAKLPGKKMQNISLFSGGEKALTAISLIFSIFSIKPSPFCVLDEVDAPFDDANISRFNEAVQALNDKSQFVIITHNKRTMEMLDVLYGITMEEPGVSRVVSVRLGDFEDKIEDVESLKDYGYPQETLLS